MHYGLSQGLSLLNASLIQQRILLVFIALLGGVYGIGAQASEQRTPEINQPVVVDSEDRELFLGEPLARGVRERRYWSAGQPLSGLAMPTPVLIASGQEPGPVLCLTAAVHGDELNGVEIIRQVLYGLDTKDLNGTVVGVPIVNLHGFRRSSRYLPDRRDLNRYFPGDPDGSSAARIAYSFFTEVMSHCDLLIDIHTGSFHRTNLPQLRADLSQESVVKLSRLFGNIAVLHSEGSEGTLRRAAVDAGVPAVTIEAGEPLRLQPEEVEQGVAGIQSVMVGLGMVEGAAGDKSQSVYYESSWLRADRGGILISEAGLGERVKAGDVLGSVTDPITNERSLLRAPSDARILGMALNQMVMPGFAAYHLGLEKADSDVAAQAVAEKVTQEALEPVREAVTEIVKEAAAQAARQTDDPEILSTVAREAAEKATQNVAAQVNTPIVEEQPPRQALPAEGEDHPESNIDNEVNDED